jgi:hypothetical protein
MSVSEATTGGKSVAALVESLEKQVARRSDTNWHEGLKSSTKIALEKINGAFDAKWISADESLSLKQRVYSVQDKLIELALW